MVKVARASEGKAKHSEARRGKANQSKAKRTKAKRTKQSKAKRRETKRREETRSVMHEGMRTSNNRMEGWWMVQQMVRPVSTMFLTARITIAAALASKPVPCRAPFPLLEWKRPDTSLQGGISFEVVSITTP